MIEFYLYVKTVKLKFRKEPGAELLEDLLEKCVILPQMVTQI